MLADIVQDLLKPEILWFLIGLFLVFGEMILPGLVLLFFGVGAIITSVCCMIFEIDLNVQLIIFSAASIVTLLSLRSVLKKTFIGSATKSQGDMPVSISEFVGQEAIVTEAIEANRSGKVELNGTDWKAVSDTAIASGETVIVSGQKNLTLEVKQK